MTRPILRVETLRTYFPIQRGLLRRTAGFVRAVDGVTFDLLPGETIGIVGESGCGKSTLLRSIVGLIKPSSGTIQLDGNTLTASSRHNRQILQDMQMVFQNPYASLNPKMTIGSIIREPLQVLQLLSKDKWNSRVNELLQLVGLNPDDTMKFPHQFSGGQRQRIGIARALACSPRLLLLDEPVAALDVSIQAQVLNLLSDLQQDLGLTYVFVSHDLAVVRYLSTRILVLRQGRMIEMADTEELFANPLHPYTQTLLAAVPIPDPDAEQSMVTGDLVDTSAEAMQETTTLEISESEWKRVKPNHYVTVSA
ncbi:ABC transporter ATP-binding protein [Alicyclobacillus mengziensis]|uniref:ABC transporter ATP-binding protein n=1 Tax=Alicyclobacillus mengziensis TaxID=2931921 RepID=A0A9X7VX16_9BACL|nr:ATP-binding cassette domain-containing protein [Alicyclobacillus mengziensis]QSO46656.1 ABC transporter ATP-binding protein [Alicyclobacillus mengziensis]